MQAAAAMDDCQCRLGKEVQAVDRDSGRELDLYRREMSSGMGHVAVLVCWLSEEGVGVVATVAAADPNDAT
jgi:hypothetical protein